MFGISEKEFERQEHAERLLVIKSKSDVFSSALGTSTLLPNNDIFFVGNRAFRKSFVHSIGPTKNSETGETGTFIDYLDFELNGRSSLTKRFYILDSEISFEEIKAIIGG